MKVAKNYRKPNFDNSTIMLDIGDIYVSIESEYRKKLIFEMHTINGMGDNNIFQDLENSWNEIDAGRFYRFLPLEKELSPHEIQSFACNWAELKDEKSTLRAVVNGKLIGVPEYFYDHLIRKEIPDGEFIMVRLIGNILGKHPLGVGDLWYAKRINKMIEEGELMVVQKKKEIYSKYLKRVKGYLQISIYWEDMGIIRICS